MFRLTSRNEGRRAGKFVRDDIPGHCPLGVFGPMAMHYVSDRRKRSPRALGLHDLEEAGERPQNRVYFTLGLSSRPRSSDALCRGWGGQSPRSRKVGGRRPEFVREAVFGQRTGSRPETLETRVSAQALRTRSRSSCSTKLPPRARRPAQKMLARGFANGIFRADRKTVQFIDHIQDPQSRGGRRSYRKERRELRGGRRDFAIINRSFPKPTCRKLIALTRLWEPRIDFTPDSVRNEKSRLRKGDSTPPGPKARACAGSTVAAYNRGARRWPFLSEEPGVDRNSRGDGDVRRLPSSFVRQTGAAGQDTADRCPGRQATGWP